MLEAVSVCAGENPVKGRWGLIRVDESPHTTFSHSNEESDAYRGKQRCSFVIELQCCKSPDAPMSKLLAAFLEAKNPTTWVA